MYHSIVKEYDDLFCARKIIKHSWSFLSGKSFDLIGQKIQKYKLYKIPLKLNIVMFRSFDLIGPDLATLCQAGLGLAVF